MSNNSRKGLAILAGGMAFVGSANAIDLIVNGSFEDPVGTGWVGYFKTYTHTPAEAYFTGPDIPEGEGAGINYSWRHGIAEGNYTGPCIQTVDLTLGAPVADIDAGRGQYTFSAWLASYGTPGSNPEMPYLTVQFFDASSAQVGGTVMLDRVTSTFFTTFADGVTTFDSAVHLHDWAKYVRTSALPQGARTATIGVTYSPNAGLSGTPDTYTDLVKFDVTVAETRPSLDSATPTGLGIAGNAAINVGLRDGSITVNEGTIAFSYDGAPVVPAIAKIGAVTTIQYTPGVLAAGSTHSYQVIYSDNGTPVLTQTNAFSFTVANYSTLPAAFARPPGSASGPGLTVRTVLAPGNLSLDNTLTRANAQLSGLLIDPGTGLPFGNDATPGPNPDGSYDVDVINFEQGGVAAGNLPGDVAYPGILAGDANGFAIEALTYLELPAGYYRFGVNSDDGFEVSAGTTPQSATAPRMPLGAYDGGRGPGDTIFDVFVPTAGVYAFRLIHFEGGGGASCEFFSVNQATGQKILVNDPLNLDSIKGYRILTGVSLPPYVRYVVPSANASDVAVDTVIRADIWDRSTAVVPPVQLMLNGATVTPTTSKAGIVTTVSYQPPAPLAYRTPLTVDLVYGDGVSLFTNTWSFVTRGADQPPAITAQWDFNGSLAATLGLPLEYLGGATGPTAAATQFGTTASFGISGINGVPAGVMRFSGAVNNTLGYIMKHGAAPNGGPTATKVNQWTMVMDIFVATPGWHSFIQIDNLANANDGELFVNPANGIGISGNYAGNLTRGEWHRIAFAVDSSTVISKFIDGLNVGDQVGWSGAGLDGRHALLSSAILLGDEDGEGQPCYLNSVQIRNYKMRDSEIAALGGPDASGIPSVGGQWDFNDQTTFATSLTATIGADMTLLPDTEFSTTFETAAFGADTANVLHFVAGAVTEGYRIIPGGLPNAGGLKINQYTLLMDVLYPAGSQDSYRSLWQTRTNNNDDASLFIHPNSDGIGISGNYVGKILPDTWYRLGFTFDLTTRTLKRYTNGVLAGQMTLGEGVDGRWAVSSTALLFADNDGDNAPGFCNSVQFRPVILTDEEMARMGPPSAGGLPIYVPRPLRIANVGQSGTDMILEWTGGTPPFQVQFKNDLNNPIWNDFGLPTMLRSANVPIDPGAGFIRVVGQ